MLHLYPKSVYDPSLGPHLIEYQITRWCDLNCSSCHALGGRALARESELSTAAAERLLVQVSQFERPAHLLLTGGDLLYRHDIFQLVRFARELGLNIGAHLCPTPRLTPTALQKLQNFGLDYMVLSLEGGDDVTHDGIRGGGSVSGDFARTMRALTWAQRLKLPIQIHTLLVVRNAPELEAIAARIAECGVQAWQIQFLGPYRPGMRHHRVAGVSHAALFQTIHELGERHGLAIDIVGANHHIAHALSEGWPIHEVQAHDQAIPPRPIGIHAGKGMMYVDPTGVIYPSRELPVACGQIPSTWLVDVYQRHQVFRELRDVERLMGKCGICEYRDVCGGSRARAMATTGQMLSEEPDCDYLPGSGPGPVGLATRATA